MRKKLTPLAALSIAFLMTGCKSFKHINHINASVRDTAPTKRQVIGHNKACYSICKG